jgi:hypothetical protein
VRLRLCLAGAGLRPWSCAIPQILGTNSGVAVQNLLCCLGLGSLFSSWPLAQQLLRVAGTACLVTAAGMTLESPGEGLFLWGRVPEGVDVDLLVQDALRNKIVLARGASFSAGTAGRSHLRFNAVASQQPRLADDLSERLQALAGARHLLNRAGSMV